MRVIEVFGMMRGGSKSKKNKNPWTSSGESEPENVDTKSATEEETQKENLAEDIKMETKSASQEVAARSREKEDWRPGSWCRRRRWWSRRWR